MQALSACRTGVQVGCGGGVYLCLCVCVCVRESRRTSGGKAGAIGRGAGRAGGLDSLGRAVIGDVAVVEVMNLPEAVAPHLERIGHVAWRGPAAVTAGGGGGIPEVTL